MVNRNTSKNITFLRKCFQADEIGDKIFLGIELKLLKILEDVKKLTSGENCGEIFFNIL